MKQTTSVELRSLAMRSAVAAIASEPYVPSRIFGFHQRFFGQLRHDRLPQQTWARTLARAEPLRRGTRAQTEHHHDGDEHQRVQLGAGEGDPNAQKDDAQQHHRRFAMHAAQARVR